MTWPYETPYRPEQQMVVDQYGLLTGEHGISNALNKYWRSAIEFPAGGSMNFTLAAVALALGSGHPKAEDRFDEAFELMHRQGHMAAEYGSINYGDLLLLHLAAAAHYTEAGHRAHELLRRHLTLMAVMMRPINSKPYRGMGWRPAGLRSTANNWGAWYDSMIAAQLLGGHWSFVKKRPRDEPWVRMAKTLDIPRTTTELPKTIMDCGPGRPAGRNVLQFFESEIQRVVGPVRTPPGMQAVLARNVVTDETWMHLAGTRFGGNTGATWASHAVDAKTTHRAYCWRNMFGRPIKRVRPAYKKGKTNFFEEAGPAHGKVTELQDGGHVLEVFAGKWSDRLRIPDWVWGADALQIYTTQDGSIVRVPA